MQPENQSGAPVPQVPQAPQPPSPPVQPAQYVSPQPAPVASPVQPQQPVMPAPASQPQVQYNPSPVQPQATPQSAPVFTQQPSVQQVPNPLQVPSDAPATALAGQTDEANLYDSDEEEFEDGEIEEIDLSQPVSWQAKEYIHQEKGPTWYIVFGIVLAVFMAVAIFLMHSLSFALVLITIAVVIVFLAKRPPRVMEYSLSNDGLHIDNTLHRYSDYRSFGVIRDGEEFSIMLIPRRRFYPGITVYFPEEAGEDIVDVLGSRLPMRDLHLDPIDKLVRKIRL